MCRVSRYLEEGKTKALPADPNMWTSPGFNFYSKNRERHFFKGKFIAQWASACKTIRSWSRTRWIFTSSFLTGRERLFLFMGLFSLTPYCKLVGQKLQLTAVKWLHWSPSNPHISHHIGLSWTPIPNCQVRTMIAHRLRDCLLKIKDHMGNVFMKR